MVKGVIFDIDGVLLDSMSIWNDLGARYLRNLGFQPEDGLNEILFSMSMEQGADYLRSHYPLNRSQEEVLEGIQGMLRDFYFYEVPLKPGAAALMKLFNEKNIPALAATSSPREYVERALERNGVLQYLQEILTTTEVGVSKHTPEIYLLAAERLGTEPGETLVAEDSLYALQTAKRAGFFTVGIYDADGETDQSTLRKDADIYVMNPGELINVLKIE